jgi:hypothetical protein
MLFKGESMTIYGTDGFQYSDSGWSHFRTDAIAWKEDDVGFHDPPFSG